MSALDAPYAAFIWPAYGATALVVGWMVIDSLLKARAWKKKAEAAEKAKAP